MASISRREFFSRGTRITAGAVAALTPCTEQHGVLAAHQKAGLDGAASKRRLAIVGTGGRCLGAWGPTLESEYGDYLQVVGLCDRNRKRAEYVRSKFATDVPVFTNFDQMVRGTAPETIVVTCTDSAHAQYVVRAMELGCNVICEKPFGTDEKQCQAMVDAQKKHGRDIIVTFNCRYMQGEAKVKELLLAGEIGEVYSVNYDELLNLDHGASYFRRWHGYKKYSGTLLVSKASHHFDEINWWLDSDPEEVTAYGDLKKYGRNGPFRHTKCRQCPHASKCAFYWDITMDKRSMELYVDCESEDGYLRDACLYRKDLDTYDTNTVMIRYANGALATYNLNAALPYEGQRIAVNGSQGRIELHNYYSQPWQVPHRSEIRLTRNFKDSVLIYPDEAKGGHGGADKLLQDHLFVPGTQDGLARRAGSRAGVMSAIVGIAGYRSIEKGGPVRIEDLVDLGTAG